MAKKKLTIEDVLVPKDEIPYEVPENWCWVKLGGLVDEVKNGTTIKQNKDEIGPKVTRIESVQNNKIDFNRIGYITEQEKIKESDWYEAGDIALSHINSIEHVGKTALIEENYLPLVHGMNLLRIRLKKELINPKYFAIYTQGYDFKSEVVDRVNRAVNQVSLNQKRLNEIPIIVPPLAEQVRIVNIIESLFDKVDMASSLVDEARDGFEKRRAAILERAFSGELTRQWRKDNGVELNVEIKVFNDIATVKSNLVKPQEHMNYPHIAPDNIEKKTGRLLEYRTIEEDNVKSAKHKFYPNQILYSKIRPYLSKVVIVDFEGLCSADMYPIETELETKYLYWYMLSQKFVDYASNCGSRSVLPKINQKELGKIPVSVFSKEEQKEIVKIIDKLIEAEKSVEEISDISECTEAIKKSILAKAFRGELGSNDIDEKSSRELIETLL